MMKFMVAIRGHFDGKVFVPDEPVNLPRDQSVVLHVEPTVSEGAGSTEHFLTWVVENLVEKTDLPADGAFGTGAAAPG
jgi:hypothetical protein